MPSSKFNRGAEDEAVLAQARSESRILLTEDKDFAVLVYAGGQQNAGVVLIRFPGDARREKGSGREASETNTESGSHFSPAKTRDVEGSAIEILDHPLSL
jgi:Domain of unknown function (DUF5615)